MIWGIVAAVAVVAAAVVVLATGYLRADGWTLAAVTGFDLFPMTHHVECVALLTKTGSDLR